MFPGDCIDLQPKSPCIVGMTGQSFCGFLTNNGYASTSTDDSDVQEMSAATNLKDLEPKDAESFSNQISSVNEVQLEHDNLESRSNAAVHEIEVASTHVLETTLKTDVEAPETRVKHQETNAKDTTALNIPRADQSPFANYAMVCSDDKAATALCNTYGYYCEKDALSHKHKKPHDGVSHSLSDPPCRCCYDSCAELRV